MRCPLCNKDPKLPTYALHNVDAYGVPARVRTSCCKQIIWLRPVRSYKLEAYTGQRTEDDWGN